MKFNNPLLKNVCGKNCANLLTVTVLIASRWKGDGRPSWQLIIELKTATERRDQRAIM
ncbi:hypothetical protein DPMN_128501 [Dreissena polymorpha]|uniref:Uncharacterized protein n=1 Tax=Dreissena polymorpha TaxID=45954 RepID=A0A9D4H797_DREPO|nr:hypothetical protein DPMN_128501 [Dreissena polymorpha]